jgi:hypothetical protein
VVFLEQFLNDVVQDDISELLFGVFLGVYLVEHVLALRLQVVEVGLVNLRHHQLCLRHYRTKSQLN